MRLPSASALNRVMECPASLVLPQTPDEGSESAKRGTEIHSYLAHQIDPTQPTPVMSEETSAFMRGFDVRPLFDGYTVEGVESTFTYDVGTGEVQRLPPGTRAYYRTSETVIGGTADLILRNKKGQWLVVDFKTGLRVEPPAVNRQLLFFAFCLHKLYGAEEVIGRIVFLYDFKVTQQSALYPREQIAGFELSLMQLVVKLEDTWRKAERNLPLTPTAGEWCKYCPAYNACPAQRHLMTTLVQKTHPMQQLSPQVLLALTPAEAGIAWQKLQEFKRLIEQLEAEFKLFAAETPIELEDGTVLEMKSRTRETIDAEKARALLRSQYSEKVMEQATEFVVKKESVRSALKANGFDPKEIGGFLKALKAAGGLKVSSYETLQKSRKGDTPSEE